MAEVTTIARPYAEAIFQLADKSNALAAWSATLGRMAEVAQHPDVLTCIGNPNLTGRQLTALFLSLCGDGVSAEAKNFVSLLVENRRLALLPQIRDLFEQSKHEREGVLDVQVVSAFPLDDYQLGNVVGHLESKYRRKVSAQVTIDKELIGGVKIVIGDEVIDGSVRGKLEHMRAVLTT
jgi:F-type H+-transporting ATPase subunit delta